MRSFAIFIIGMIAGTQAAMIPDPISKIITITIGTIASINQLAFLAAKGLKLLTSKVFGRSELRCVNFS
jgi:hypothetical protein